MNVWINLLQKFQKLQKLQKLFHGIKKTAHASGPFEFYEKDEIIWGEPI